MIKYILTTYSVTCISCLFLFIMQIAFKCVVGSHKEKLTFPLHVNDLVKLNVIVQVVI